jgi:hypothetical protein
LNLDQEFCSIFANEAVLKVTEFWLFQLKPTMADKYFKGSFQPLTIVKIKLNDRLSSMNKSHYLETQLREQELGMCVAF